MANTKKRMLTFQTPKKKAMTPLRSSSRSSQEITEDPTPKASKKTEEKQSLENKLIEAYREENNYLRNLKTDAILYSKLLGITISENNGVINFTIERSSSTGLRRLKFNLEDKDDVYVFTLEDSENCNIPDYFYDVLEFDKKAFSLFFYKAMQAVYETRVNQ